MAGDPDKAVELGELGPDDAVLPVCGVHCNTETPDTARRDWN